MTAECIVAGFGGAALSAWWVSRNSEKLLKTTHENALSLVKLTHNKDIALMQRQEFNRAATEFLCGFTCTITTLTDLENGGNSNIIMNYLLSEYTAHRNAINRFKLYLSESESERAGIEKAWGGYCYDETGEYELSKAYRFYKYSLGYTPLAETYEKDFEAKKQLAINSVNRLLSFAELK